MLLVEMWGSKKALSRVVGHPAAELSVIPAPTQEKEEDLTNSIDNLDNKRYTTNKLRILKIKKW